MLAVPSPPPPPLPSFDSAATSVASDGDGHSGGPSLLIISGIIAFVIAASAAIHLLLRLISRSRSPSSPSSSFSSSSSSPPSPTPLLHTVPSVTTGGGGAAPPSDRDQLIASLPLFSLASSVAAAPKSSSLDCAVCLSAFRPHDELRLLPACRHAFHSQCVDIWLRSTPSCPLCRSSIHLPPQPPPQLPPTATAAATANLGYSRSGSFRVELGSVSRRRPSSEGIPAGGGGAAHGRSYSLGSSFEYLVEEEVEAVLERLRKEKPENGTGGGAPSAPGADVAESAGGGGRGWLRDCVDRLTSSASSSFNSLRISARYGSRRFDSASAGGEGGGGGRSWDLEANSFVQWEEESEFGMFYRWLVGV